MAERSGMEAGPDRQLDQAGRTILQLLNEAAGVAERNSRQAVDAAERLSHQLRAAEQRISELEAEVDTYREKAERGEQWLDAVHTQIEQQF
jgi:hypothetical protein